MAAITKIGVRIKTGDRSNAGTDGYVYLGIGGREFHLNSNVPGDFEQGRDRTYVLGAPVESGEVAVTDSAYNDPRNHYVLVSENLDKFPVYLRFEPSGSSPDWNLESVTVTVKSQTGTILATYSILGGSNHLWLGTNIGKYCYLLKS